VYHITASASFPAQIISCCQWLGTKVTTRVPMHRELGPGSLALNLGPKLHPLRSRHISNAIRYSYRFPCVGVAGETRAEQSLAPFQAP
jgi:hypothetical protein